MISFTNHILFFVKYPRPGLVKTRLAEQLGNTEVIELYRCFVLDILDTLKESSFRIWICYWPPDEQRNIRAWLGSGYDYLPQQGSDLGERLESCFAKVFGAGAERAIALGSDSPDIPLRLIDEGFQNLKTEDVVIGPAHDGGYYLIGFRSDTFMPNLFDGIPWSTDKVYQKTIDKIKQNGKTCNVLDTWHDIDTMDDIKTFMQKNAAGEFSSSRTMKFLRELSVFGC